METGFLLPFKSNFNIQHSRFITLSLCFTLSNLASLSSPCLENLHSVCVCVFRLRLLFIQSDPTRRPDGHWIIRSFIFKSTALSSQCPNQLKSSKHRTQHSPSPQEQATSLCRPRFLRVFCCRCSFCFHERAGDSRLLLTQLTRIFLGVRFDSEVIVQAAETVYVLQAVPICRASL